MITAKLPMPLAHVGRMSPYVPGHYLEAGNWIKLNTNECAYPVSDAVTRAIVQELADRQGGLRRYPDPQCYELRSALAQHHSLTLKQIAVGNGSSDILNQLIRAFCDREHAIGMMVPSYSLYASLALAQGAPLVAIDFTPELGLPVDAIVHSGVALFCLTSPNAPLGIALSIADIVAILEQFPGLLVVDEAYVAFATDNALSLLQHYPNLVIIRTFSKSHGLAGLRVGYALAHPDIIAALSRVRDGYAVDRLAQVGALAALKDDAYYTEVIEKTLSTRRAMATFLAKLGWPTYPSETNFLLTQPMDRRGRSSMEVAQALFSFLRQCRILVRYFPTHRLTERCLRISIGTKNEMDYVQSAIQQWSQQMTASYLIKDR